MNVFYLSTIAFHQFSYFMHKPVILEQLEFLTRGGVGRGVLMFDRKSGGGGKGLRTFGKNLCGYIVLHKFYYTEKMGYNILTKISIFNPK